MVITNDKNGMNSFLITKYIITFKHTFGAVLLGYFSAFGLEPILLNASVQVDLLVKGLPVLLTVISFVYGWRWTSKKMKEEANRMTEERITIITDRLHKVQDQYKENFKFMVEMGIINSETQKGEIDELMQLYFPSQIEQ